MKTITNKRYNGEKKTQEGMSATLPVLVLVFSFGFIVMCILTIYTQFGLAAPIQTHTVSVHMSHTDHVYAEITLNNGETFDYTFEQIIQRMWEERQYILNLGNQAFAGWYMDAGRTIPYNGQEITADTNIYARWVTV